MLCWGEESNSSQLDVRQRIPKAPRPSFLFCRLSQIQGWLCLLARDSLELHCNLHAEGGFSLVILFCTCYLILIFHIQQIIINTQVCTSLNEQASSLFSFKTWLFSCLSCFPIAVAKHQEQGNFQKKVFNWVYDFQRVRIRYNRCACTNSSSMSPQLAPQAAGKEGTRKMTQIFWYLCICPH